MKKIKFFGIGLIIASMLFTSTAGAKDMCMSWYCVRNKEHKQPLADAPLRIVENTTDIILITAMEILKRRRLFI